MAGFDLKSLLGQQYMSPMQGMIQGASQAIAPMTGYTKTPVSMGQLIGAAGGGAMQGQNQARQQNMQGAMQNMSIAQVQAQMAAAKLASDKLAELTKHGAIMSQRALAAGNVDAAMQWKHDPARMMAHQQSVALEKSKYKTPIDPRLGWSAARKYATDSGHADGTPEFKAAMTEYVKKVPLIDKGESAYDAAMGGSFAKNRINIANQARSSYQDDAQLDLIGSLLQGQGGFAAQEINSLKRVGKALGIGVDEGVGRAEAAQAISNKMALDMRNPDTGPGMPGSMSDADREFLVSLIPGIGQTEAGRNLVIEAKKRVNKWNRKIDSMARAYEQEHGRIDSGFDAVVEEYAKLNPVFKGLNVTAAMASKSSPAGAPVTTASGAIVTPLN